MSGNSDGQENWSPENWKVYKKDEQELVNASVNFEGEDDVTISNDDWTLTMNLDVESRELIFNVIIAPNKWLAIGLANDFFNADVIQWISGPSGSENAG